ncbi:MAG: hypothetical protein C5B48_03740 [Candidatus Rokuibacteriota bacterium]|nr:MAG: hypothetical protein C5B48_03740 [Candidatus Rokubacteria bacterium]
MTDLTHPVRLPAFRGLLNALIEEARRRARRRRAIYGGVGLSTAVGAIVFAVLQGSANPQSGSPELVAGQGAQVAPAQGPPVPVGATYVILNRGDVVLLQGSTVLCTFKSDVQLVCMLANSNGPLPHSWGTGMNIDGAVEVFRFDANGKSTTTKKFRRLLGPGPGEIYHPKVDDRVYRLKVGDRFRAGSTRIACRIKRGNSSFGRSPVAHCYYIAPKTIKTTREFVINNFFAGVYAVQLTLSGAGTILDVQKLKTLYAKKQPRLGSTASAGIAAGRPARFQARFAVRLREF